MISEIFGMLSSVDDATKGLDKKFKVNLNKNRIRSISAYSSNSIFYFPVVVINDCTPEEVAMISRTLEKSFASFVVACISLMPFHRIKADDKASIEEYLQQFHQNLGMNQGSSAMMNKLFAYADSTVSESTSDAEQIKATQDFLMECWHKSLSENSDFVSVIAETVSLNDMYQEDPIDPKTRVLQEQYFKVQEEMDTWGFIGEATSEMFDSDDSITDMSDDEIAKAADPTDTKPILNEKGQREVNEGTVKQAIDSIRFSLEAVSANKIMSCQSLTKLASLEAKLNKLKNKYTKYLNRYKKKYNENKKSGSKSKLSIRFNNLSISNPKAFMQQYGTYLKLINKRLKLVEKRRAELRKRKGLPEAKEKLEESVTLTQMDFDAIEYCDKLIQESIDAPDSQIFTLTEDVSDDEYQQLLDRFNNLKSTVGNVASKARVQQKTDTFIRQSYRDQKAINRDLQKKLDQLEKTMEDQSITLEKKDKALEDFKKKYAPNADDADQGDTDFGRPQSGLVASRFAKANRASGRDNNIKVFDKEVFTDMEMKKANEAIPIFTKATISFIVDETEEVVSRDILVGIKAYIHRAPANELVTDIYNCIINKRKFLKFVKFITGEERSLSDLLFGIKELRTDALDAKSASGQWRSAFKRRKRWSKISLPYLMKEYTPNGSIVMTMNSVNFIKDQYGIDIMDPNHVKMIMDADFLLAFVVVDQAEEMVYINYDGHGYGFQQYTYAMLEREQQSSDRMMRELYRSFSSGR